LPTGQTELLPSSPSSGRKAVFSCIMPPVLSALFPLSVDAPFSSAADTPFLFSSDSGVFGRTKKFSGSGLPQSISIYLIIIGHVVLYRQPCITIDRFSHQANKKGITGSPCLIIPLGE
jgi:hypothetical protein